MERPRTREAMAPPTKSVAKWALHSVGRPQDLLAQLFQVLMEAKADLVP